ncbi:hypothetical protein ACIRPP_06870 [Streptomyces sp. NPDC101219]|uniref:hypothetical protein n=1 Tax=Streptomyces sp. NPDC101219 TaxID=3366131 RepID=UPI0038002BA0
MGIESDQVVYEYLSRVGDVAQQRQLPSSARMRLVTELRDEIDRRRAKAVVDSPAAVRRILSRIGTPSEVVTAATHTAGPAPEAADAPAASAPAAVPVQREGGAREAGSAPATDLTKRPGRPKGVLGRIVPGPRPAAPSAPDPAPPPADVPSSPHRAGTDELGDSATQPDWWRVDSSPFGVGDEVPGFIGGVEIPELLKPPPDGTPPAGAGAAAGAGAGAGADADAAEPADAVPAAVEAPARRRLWRPSNGSWNNPLLLLAAALLVAGAVLGTWLALLLGWLIAWASRRLTPAESKWAVVVIPGLALTAGLTWLWGRTAGRWGEPIAEGAMNEAVSETWPWVVRGAAVASALFLVWRSQRQR